MAKPAQAISVISNTSVQSISPSFWLSGITRARLL